MSENNFNYNNLPPFKWFILENFPFIEADFDALTNWQLFCKLGNEMNKIINSQNTIGTQMETLTNAYIQLENYVNNYFDNLDVQEEINNKLDEMVESGVLESIIVDYLNTKAIFCYDTVSDLKLATNLIADCYVRTLGFNSIGDGGGSLYKMSDSETANEKDKIECLNDLVAVLINTPNEIYPEQIGAYGDNSHDDTELIQYCINNYNTIKLYNKTYIAKGLYVPSNKTIIGNETLLKGNNSTNGLMLFNNTNTDITNVHIQNIRLLNYQIGLFAINVNHSLFERIIIKGCDTDANFGGSTWTNKFYNCEFKDSRGDGFKCGLTVHNPLLDLYVPSEIATFDFYSCEFANNSGYGINGLMRVFNFYGGYAQNNTSGAVRIESTTNVVSQELNFNGFDIEQEKIGYFFENTNGRCGAQFINIVGGQIALDTPSENEKAVLLYFKGTTCTETYVHNINVSARHNASSSVENVYVIYIDTPEGQGKVLQCNINAGNLNNANFNTNATVIIPNNIYKNNEITFPLSVFSNENFDGTNVVIPAKASIEVAIPELKYLQSLKITTSDASNLRCQFFGCRVTDYRQTGSGTAVSDANNVCTFTVNLPVSVIKIINLANADVTITQIKLTGLTGR